MKKLLLALVALLSVTLPGMASKTVYFDTSEDTNWGVPHVHYWNDNGQTTSWPGELMTLVSGTVYKYDIPDWAVTCKFNANTDSDNKQTGNFSINANHRYTKFSDKGTYTVTYPTTFYLKGNFENASWSNPITMTNLGNGKYEKTVKFTFDGNNTVSYFRFNADSNDYGPAEDENPKHLTANNGVATGTITKLSSERNYTFTPESLSTEYTISVDLAAGTIKVAKVGTTSDPVDPTYELYYGSTAIPMELTDGKYVATATLPSDTSFKIRKTIGSTTTTIGSNNDSDWWIMELPANTLSTKENGAFWIVKFGAISATYSFDATNNILSVTKAGGDTPVDPTGKVTVYLHTTSWGTPKAYVWNGSNQYLGAWPGSAMTSIGNGYYKIEFSAEAKSLIFSNNGNNQTGNLTIYPGHVYETDGSHKEFSQEDATSKYVYFNLFADYFNKSFYDGKVLPWAIMHKDGQPTDGNDYYDRVQMELVEGETTMFRAKVENPDAYDFMVFAPAQYPSEGGDQQSFTNKNTKNLKKADTEGKSTKWFEYIYCYGGEWANQSYLTFEQYKQLRDNAKTTIYFLGRNVGNGTWNMNNPVRATKDESVYLLEIDLSSYSFARFKMSYINPSDFAPAGTEAWNVKDDDHGNRWWATFNLGIIGPVSTAASKDMNDSDGNEDNGYIQYTIRRTEEFNFYNQFDWRVQKVDGINKYWIVVDADYGTSAMLGFDPTATMTASADIDLINNDDNLGTGTEIYGSENSGHVYMPFVNHAHGTVDVQATDFSRVSGDNYDVYYRLFYEENEEAEEQTLGIYHGVPSKLHMDYMIAGSGAQISARAHFVDKAEGRTYTNERKDADGNVIAKVGDHLRFRSRTVKAKVETSPDLQAPLIFAPDATKGYKKLWSVEPLGGENMLWAAMIRVPYELMDYTHPMHGFSADNQNKPNEAKLAWYPAFEAKATNGAEGRIAEKELWMVNADKTFYKGGYTGHTPAFGYSDYQHWNNNWAALADKSKEEDGNHGDYHLYVPGVAVAPSGTEINTTITLKGYAAYPFIIDPDQEIRVEGTNEAAEVRRFSARRNAEISAQAEKNLELVTVHVPAHAETSDGNESLNIEVTSKENLSGITSPELVGADANAEYFNLQGLRVEGEITPGVYIVRRGDKVTKEYVK